MVILCCTTLSLTVLRQPKTFGEIIWSTLCNMFIVGFKRVEGNFIMKYSSSIT